MITLTFHTDPGHGWLEVPKSLAHSLGITISPWSYEKGDNYFLEEDLDANTFMEAARESGLKIKTIGNDHRNSDSPIRNYDSVRDPKYVSPFKS